MYFMKLKLGHAHSIIVNHVSTQQLESFSSNPGLIAALVSNVSK